MKDQADLDAEELLPCAGPGWCWSSSASLEEFGHKEKCCASYRPAVAAKLREQLKAEAERVTERDAAIAYSHRDNGAWTFIGQQIAEKIRDIQAEERE